MQIHDEYVTIDFNKIDNISRIFFLLKYFHRYHFCLKEILTSYLREMICLIGFTVCVDQWHANIAVSKMYV